MTDEDEIRALRHKLVGDLSDMMAQCSDDTLLSHVCTIRLIEGRAAATGDRHRREVGFRVLTASVEMMSAWEGAGGLNDFGRAARRALNTAAHILFLENVEELDSLSKYLSDTLTLLSKFRVPDAPAVTG